MSFQDPTQAIASGLIFQINTAVSTFQRLINSLGTPKDTPELRQQLHKTRIHIGQLVKDTSDKLKQTSHESDHRAEVSASKKIIYANFQGVLKEFQNAQRLAAERETTYTPLVPQALLPSSNAFNEVIIKEREQGIQEIQNQIVEVNKILKDLVVLVHEQGVRIDDIRSYIENSHDATTHERSHLLKESKTHKANSSMTWLLFVIVVIVLCISTIILAV